MGLVKSPRRRKYACSECTTRPSSMVALRRLQRLAQHLPAEHLRAAGVAALAAKQVDLEPFELELLLQVGEALVHQPIVSRT